MEDCPVQHISAVPTEDTWIPLTLVRTRRRKGRRGASHTKQKKEKKSRAPLVSAWPFDQQTRF